MTTGEENRAITKQIDGDIKQKGIICLFSPLEIPLRSSNINRP
jgi:hypothetical protein